MFVALLSLLAVLVAGGAWLIGRIRYVPPDAPVDTTPRAVASARRAADAAQATLRAARRDAHSGVKRPYRVEVREDHLNALLRTDPSARRLLRQRGIARPRVQVKNGLLTASALVRYRGERVFITVEGPVAAGEAGQLRFLPEKVWLGKAEAPQAITEEIARRVTRAFETGELQLPGRVKAVRMEQGRLVVEGST